MSKLYTARVYDETGNLLAVLENTKAAYFSRKANQATEVGFSLPRNDPKAQYLEIAHSFDLYRFGRRIISGIVTKRDFTGNPLRIVGMTNTIKLSQMQTPAKWVWDGVDLADVYRDLLLRFRWVRKNTQADFEAGQRYQVDTATEPGSVMLAKNADKHYLASGYVTTGPIDLGTNVARIDRLRLATREGEKVRISAQIRTSDDNVTWSAWSMELTTNFWDQGVDLVSLALSQPHRYIDVKLNLYTSDTTTPDNEQNPTVYGFTPILDAAEIVWREASELSAGTIPASFGRPVRGFEANFENHLAVARTLAEKYQAEFEVDGDDRLNVAEALGSDLSNSILLKRGGNINVTTLSDDDSNIQNVVTCLGKGDGVGQLATVLRNETSIAKYGERPGKYENKDCEDMVQLITEGNAYLAEHADPKQAFQVDVIGVPDHWPEFRQGDTVLVVDPTRGINQAVRILEEKRQDSEAGERVTLGLNAELPDLAAMLAYLHLGQYHPPSPETTAPRKPANLVALGEIGQIALSWSGRYDYVIIEHSADNVAWNVLEATWQGNSYRHANLAFGSQHWYRVTGVITGQKSPAAGPVSAVARDTVPPATPTGLAVASAVRGLTVTLNANAEADWDGFEIHVSTTSGFTPDASTLKAKGKATRFDIIDLAPGTTYYVKARAYDTSGNFSGYTTQVSGTAGRVGTGDIAPSAVDATKIAPGVVVEGNLAYVAVGTVNNGTRVTLAWPQTRVPKVNVSPTDLLTFNAARNTVSQTAKVYATTPFWDGSQWNFDVYGMLVASGASTNNGTLPGAYPTWTSGDSPANTTGLFATLYCPGDSGVIAAGDGVHYKLEYKLSADPNWTIGISDYFMQQTAFAKSKEVEIKSGLPAGVYQIRVTVISSPGVDPSAIANPTWRSVADEVIYNGTITYVATA